MNMRSRYWGNLVRNADGAAGGAAQTPPATPAAPPTMAGAGLIGTPPAPATPPAGAAPAGGSPTQTPPAGETWFKDLPAGLHPTIQAKGWRDAADAIESYVNLEKIFGADKAGNTIMKPKADAPVEDQVKFFRELGAPDKPDGYDFKGVDGLDLVPPDTVAAAREWFANAGLTPTQANEVMKASLAREAKMAQEWLAHSQREENEVRVEWGSQFEQNVEVARRAFRASGLEPDKLQAMERAVGTKAMLKMFHTFGQGFLEHGAPDATPRPAGGFQASPQDITAKINALEADSQFQARLLSTNQRVRQAAIDERNALYEARAKLQGALPGR